MMCSEALVSLALLYITYCQAQRDERLPVQIGDLLVHEHIQTFCTVRQPHGIDRTKLPCRNFHGLLLLKHE